MLTTRSGNYQIILTLTLPIALLPMTFSIWCAVMATAYLWHRLILKYTDVADPSQQKAISQLRASTKDGSILQCKCRNRNLFGPLISGGGWFFLGHWSMPDQGVRAPGPDGSTIPDLVKHASVRLLPLNYRVLIQARHRTLKLTQVGTFMSEKTSTRPMLAM